MEDKSSRRPKKNLKDKDNSDQTVSKINKENLPDPCRDTLSKISSYHTKPDRTIFIDSRNNDAWISSDKTQKIIP